MGSILPQLIQIILELCGIVELRKLSVTFGKLLKAFQDPSEDDKFIQLSAATQ